MLHCGQAVVYMVPSWLSWLFWLYQDELSCHICNATLLLPCVHQATMCYSIMLLWHAAYVFSTSQLIRLSLLIISRDYRSKCQSCTSIVLGTLAESCLEADISLRAVTGLDARAAAVVMRTVCPCILDVDACWQSCMQVDALLLPVFPRPGMTPR